MRLTAEDEDKQLSSEDVLDATVAATLSARRGSSNLEITMRSRQRPRRRRWNCLVVSPSPMNLRPKRTFPKRFMCTPCVRRLRKGLFSDVLKNYTNYKVAYQLAQKIEASDEEVDSKKAKVKLNRWVRLHEYNISQKVKVIIDHYKEHVMGLLGGQAKAMVVTSSRKEAVRYKLAFDKYLTDSSNKKQSSIAVMIAFSGEVEFHKNDPDSAAILDQKIH